MMITVFDEVTDLSVEIARLRVVLQRLMQSFNLALSLRMIGRPSNMGHLNVTIYGNNALIYSFFVGTRRRNYIIWMIN